MSRRRAAQARSRSQEGRPGRRTSLSPARGGEEDDDLTLVAGAEGNMATRSKRTNSVSIRYHVFFCRGLVTFHTMFNFWY